MNSEQQEEHQADIVRLSLGQRLKSAREVQGLSVKEVADNLRLRVSVIEEIEKDRINSDNIPAYTRGYIRSYAKLLSIGTESLLSECQHAQGLQSTVRMQSFSRKTSKKKNDNRLMSLTWAILSLVVGVTFIWGWQSSQKQAAQEQEIAQTIKAQTPSPLNTNASSANTSSANTSNTNTSSTNTSNTNTSNTNTSNTTTFTNPTDNFVSNALAQKINPPKAIPKAVPPTVNDIVPSKEPMITEPVVNESLLHMNFIADCWVDIRDGNGKRLLTGIKSRGESVELDGKEPFKIVLGAPSAVELTYKGEDIDLSGYPPKRVARLTLPQK